MKFTALVFFATCSLYGCTAEGDTEAANALKLQFPDQAAEVLESSEAFVVTEKGFSLSASAGPEAARGFEAELPRDGAGKGIFRVDLGFEVRVRELDVDGPGTIAKQAVAYRRKGGTSFWTAVPGGVEEWLLLAEGIAKRGEAVAAWEVEGGTLRQQGEAIEVIDANGAVRMQVTAPRAYAAGGRAVDARLAVRGATVELSVDADGEAVLVDPAWTATGSMITSRMTHSAIRLAFGSVLVTGGMRGSSPGVVNQWLSSAEMYNATTRTWSSAGSMLTQGVHETTLLSNGKVLVTGGWGPAPYYTGTNVELYDPTSNTWSTAASMNVGRDSHTTTRLGDGRVLIAGGSISGAAANPELYNPTTNSWTFAGAMITQRWIHGATLLTNGKVLVVGGVTTYGGDSYILASAELYDPATNTWASAGSMSIPRYLHTATLLDNGKVLVAGGAATSGTFGTIVATAELYDPATNTWASAEPMGCSRAYHTATKLGNGKVLAAGGIGECFSASAELYDPTSNAWTPVDSMNVNRSEHTATLLEDGKVLVAGGYRANTTGEFLTSCELYDPLFGDLPGHLLSARQFVDNVVDAPYAADAPDTNRWGSPGTIDWASFTGTTQGASLFTLCLIHSDPAITSSVVSSWWGATSPTSSNYYSQIVAGNHFTRVSNISDVRPGDLLAVNYTDSPGSGHLMIVDDSPAALATAVNPIVSGTTQYALRVIDSTSTAHGCATSTPTSDERWVPTVPANPCAGGSTDGGAGRGTIRLYAVSAGLANAGTLAGYSWSLTSGTTYYPQSGTRPHAIGRFKAL